MLLRVALLREVQIVPAPQNGVITESVYFKPGGRWYNIYGTPGRLRYSCPWETTDHGRIYKPTVRVFWPSDSAAVMKAVQDTQWERYILDVVDVSGLRRLVGNASQGLTLSGEMDTNEDMGADRGYTLEWRGDLTMPAAIYAPV